MVIKRISHSVKQHLFPTAHNGFIPRLLRERAVFALLGIGIALFSFLQIARGTNYFGFLADVYPAVVFSLTNKDREANRLPVLTINEDLTRAAQLKADDMAAKGYFAHTSPEGVTPWFWFAKAGYSFMYAGENLAINFDDSNAVQEAWLDSPSHRANIMNDNFTEMGIAVASGIYNGTPATFVVEMFGMPATPRVFAATPEEKTPVAADPASSISKTPPKVLAGESTIPLKVLEETPTFQMTQNTDMAVTETTPTPAPAPSLPWYKRLVLKSDIVVRLIIEAIIVATIIATAGLIAREYEKRHRIHMAYGTLLVIVMTTFLFVEGFTSNTSSPLTASSFSPEEVLPK